MWLRRTPSILTSKKARPARGSGEFPGPDDCARTDVGDRTTRWWDVLSAVRRGLVYASSHIGSNRSRLVACIALLLVPICVLGFQFVDQSYKSIRFAERELKGLTYVRAVLSILSDLASQNTQSPLDTREFEMARTRFDTDLSTNAMSADLASALSTSSRNLAVALDSARTLLARIGDQSNLILDPELDSYYVMDALLQHVPELILTSRRLSDELASVRTAAIVQPERTAETLMRVGQLAASIRGLKKSVEAAIASSPDGKLRGSWAGPAALLVEKLQALVRGARIDIDINALSDPSAFERPDIASILTEIDFHMRSFSGVAANELERLLRARIDRFSATLMWSLSFSVLLAVFAIFVAHSVLRSMVVRLDDQIVFLAHHDPLTGLANRALLNDKLKQALTHAERDGGLLAVHLIDLDQFKNVNDTLGHPIGDKLLKLVTSRLRGIVRETDTIARMGGDEFVILQTGLTSEAEATALGRRLVEAIANPFAIDEYQVTIGNSIGMAIAAPKGQHSHKAPDDLLRDADVALYRAKGDGRGTIRVFENMMEFEVRERQYLESELRNALNVGQFELYYQPALNLARNKSVDSRH